MSGIQAKIILDSISAAGARLVTFELRYHRFIHAELMTHRVFSRNSASSRAIPISKIIKSVEEDPAMPIFWGANQKGMQAEGEIADVELAKATWLAGRDRAVETAKSLQALNLHKQLVNRVLEPYVWHTVILTATKFTNFFKLRCHTDAQPEIKHLADLMWAAYSSSTPTERIYHTPYIQPDELDKPIEELLKVSSARCARVSYLTHAGKRDWNADLELHSRLLGGSGGIGHLSPLEHPAIAAENATEAFGNFVGWKQFRKTIPGESGE